VDLVIRRHLNDLPSATRTRVQAWIEDGRVSINGYTVRRVSARTAHGDIVSVLLPDDTQRQPVLPEEGQLERLFEDDHLLIVNKAAGVVSHPTYLHPRGSLLNVLLWHAAAWPAGQRPSLVGRLDKLTSGVVLVAKSTDAHARLQRAVSVSLTDKAYLAVVYGPVAHQQGEINLRLSRDPADRRRVVATASSHGAPSLTRFERLDEAGSDRATVSVLRCQLVTGRMHQVRVHMAASGWPLVGDPKYGEPRWEQFDDARKDALRMFPRQALHAWKLSFVHPFTRERVVVEAPVPDDLQQLLTVCGLRV
jgi:23S rRNA pseudouridine1911/1915/1917 synthase